MTFNKEVWTKNLLPIPSGWEGLECYMNSIMSNLNIKPNLALEFGIDQGYSLKIFSQLFNKVIAVDSFSKEVGHPQYEGYLTNIFERFKGDNVEINVKDYRDFIKNNNDFYDLIHVDIVHFYKETYECTEWSIQHSNVVLVHDTITFGDMNVVCEDISKKYNVKYVNIPEHNGLGILYRE